MTNTGGVGQPDKARAARLALAVLDDDHAAANGVLDEAYAAGTIPPLIAALTAGLLELLVATAGEDGARKTLNMTLLDAQLAD